MYRIISLAIQPYKCQVTSNTQTEVVVLFPNSNARILTKHDTCNIIRLWWRHQMETFNALLAICAGNSPVPGEFPTQRPVMRSFDVCFDLRLDKRLSKQWWGWWFEMLSRPFWRHSNVVVVRDVQSSSCWQSIPDPWPAVNTVYQYLPPLSTWCASSDKMPIQIVDELLPRGR